MTVERFIIFRLLVLAALILAFTDAFCINALTKFHASRAYINPHYLPHVNCPLKKVLMSSKIDEKNELTKPINKYFENDNIFRIHSLGATAFGSTLLFFPGLLSISGVNPILNLAYQQWSIFILAVAVITFNAPSLDEKSKTLLSRTFFAMCSGESLLYLSDMARSLAIFTPFTFFIDFGSFLVFSFLAYGYFVSGSMKLSS